MARKYFGAFFFFSFDSSAICAIIIYGWYETTTLHFVMICEHIKQKQKNNNNIISWITRPY
jgi:hypothetical protein